MTDVDTDQRPTNDPPSDEDVTTVAPLSPRHRRGLMVVAAALAVAVGLHLFALFLNATPDNVVRRGLGPQLHGYLLPEMKQSWALFATLPKTDTRVWARLQVAGADGTVETSGWADLSEQDVQELRYNPLPSRTRMQLRKAWSEVTGSHDQGGAPIGQAGADSQRLLTRIALPRLRLLVAEGATVTGIQFRAVTTHFAAPPWEDGATTPEPTTTEMPWWSVSDRDAATVEVDR